MLHSLHSSMPASGYRFPQPDMSECLSCHHDPAPLQFSAIHTLQVRFLMRQKMVPLVCRHTLPFSGNVILPGNLPALKNGYIDKDISVQNHNRYIPTLALSTSGYGSKPISVSSQPAPGQLPFQISVLYAPYSSTNPPACPALFFLTQILHGFLGRMLCILQRCYIIPLKGQRGRR